MVRIALAAAADLNARLQRSVTAAELQAGLPAGRYSTSPTESTAAGLSEDTVMWDVYLRGGVETQVARHWNGSWARSRGRTSTGGTWTPWRTVTPT